MNRKYEQRDKKNLLFLPSGLQTTDPTHVFQCREVERTRMAYRVDVGISARTQTLCTEQTVTTNCISECSPVSRSVTQGCGIT